MSNEVLPDTYTDEESTMVIMDIDDPQHSLTSPTQATLIKHLDPVFLWLYRLQHR